MIRKNKYQIYYIKKLCEIIFSHFSKPVSGNNIAIPKLKKGYRRDWFINVDEILNKK